MASSTSHLVSSITEHLGGHQPSYTSTNYNHSLGLRGPIKSQGYNFEQLLIVRVLHASLKGVLAVDSLPFQGGHQDEEDGDQDKEVPGWGRKGDRVSGYMGGEKWFSPLPPVLSPLLTYPVRP